MASERAVLLGTEQCILSLGRAFSIEGSRRCGRGVTWGFVVQMDGCLPLRFLKTFWRWQRGCALRVWGLIGWWAHLGGGALVSPTGSRPGRSMLTLL